MNGITAKMSELVLSPWVIPQHDNLHPRKTMVWWLSTEWVRAPDMTYAKALMFGMLLHPRVGSASPYSDLPEEIMKAILGSFKYYSIKQAPLRSTVYCSPNVGRDSPDLMWLTKPAFFDIKEIGIPTVWVIRRFKKCISGDPQKQDEKRGPFAGCKRAFEALQSRRKYNWFPKHCFTGPIIEMQALIDNYYELFSNKRRFYDSQNTDWRHQILLYEPANPIVWRQAEPQFNRLLSLEQVNSWLRDLFGPRNCDRFVRVREMHAQNRSIGFQIFICGPDVDPDDILHAHHFKKFRNRVKYPLKVEV